MNLKLRLQLSSMMFLEYFIWGSWYVTMGTYLGTTLNFDGIQIGILYSTVSIGAMVSPFFVGMVADRFFPTQKVLGMAHLIGAMLIFGLASANDLTSFYPLLLGYTLCYMPTIALTNSLSFANIPDAGKNFPSIRVLGTIGWIAAGILIGTMKFEDSKMQFYIASACSLLMGVYCFTLPNTPPKDKGKSITVRDVLGLDALSLFKSKSFSIFFLSSLLICIPLSFYYTFTNPFLNDIGMENAASKMTLGQGSEILFLLVMPLFFKRLGVKKMLIVGMLAWVARYIFFALGDNGTMLWMLYTGIILHGVCFDFFFVTGQIYVDNKAGDKIKSAAQGMITFATYGLGMFIGSTFSGWIVDLNTLPNGIKQWTEIWYVPAIASGIVLLVFIILFKDEKQTAS